MGDPTERDRVDHALPTLTNGDEAVGSTGLTADPMPPPAPSAELTPDQLERYVLGGVHHDRVPGNVLVVLHPRKIHKVPRGLFEQLGERGYRVEVVHTRREVADSVSGIRDKLLELSATGEPLDLLVVSGDGSLDHHVMVAAFSAFYPGLVEHRAGRIDGSRIERNDLIQLPSDYVRGLFEEGFPEGVEPTEDHIVQIWLLRSRLESVLRKRKPLPRVLARAGRPATDPLLRVAVAAALWPDKVDLVPDHFDVEKLAMASQESTFQGLYPHIRSIACFPAGVAADNAVFAGVPGWTYATVSRVLARWKVLDALRRPFERHTIKRFVDYFCDSGVVVPARLSAIALDGVWRAVCGHVVSGPAGGHFFTQDLTRKTDTMWGYLIRIPQVILKEGVFGKTRVRVRSYDAHGELKAAASGHLAEGLYTNRTYVAGVASVPTTNPTSFAGESSLLIVPPIWDRDSKARVPTNFRALAGFWEVIAKGLISRALHAVGMSTGTLAGGGRVWGLLPSNQVAIKEGERIRIDYQHLDSDPRAVPVVISGDPFQAHRMDIQVLWGPIPMLGGRRSLLVDGVRRTLAALRLQQSYHLEHTYIGGVRYYRHRTGQAWSAEMTARSGLFLPPLHLPRNLGRSYDILCRRWQRAGAGEFVDTSKPGLPLTRRGYFAHNNDQTAHLLLLRESREMLLVRQVRVRHDQGIYETRSHYRRGGGAYIILRSQTIFYPGSGEAAQIIREAYYFRDAESFQQEAPTFLPIAGELPEQWSTELPEVAGGEDRDAAAAGHEYEYDDDLDRASR